MPQGDAGVANTFYWRGPQPGDELALSTTVGCEGSEVTIQTLDKTGKFPEDGYGIVAVNEMLTDIVPAQTQNNDTL
eukprot:SAG31_NODE_1503_length_8079_cov_5.930827_2_plen_76_part_00